MKNDSSDLRKQRIETIRRWIAKNVKEGVNLELLYLRIQVEIGLTRPRAEEYVALIMETSEWQLEDGQITLEAKA